MMTDFILEKFKFEDNFKIPPVKNINAEAVIDIYEAVPANVTLPEESAVTTFDASEPPSVVMSR